jgi:hypothetical protein
VLEGTSGEPNARDAKIAKEVGRRNFMSCDFGAVEEENDAMNVQCLNV